VVGALKSRRVVVYEIPGMEEVWGNDVVEFEITKVAVARKPWAIILATVCGKILKMPFECK
jgi:hypothetical protein